MTAMQTHTGRVTSASAVIYMLIVFLPERNGTL